MFQESEVINLLFAVLALTIAFFFFRHLRLERFRWIWIGFHLVLAALLFTVLEGVLWPDLFQLLEHFAYTLAGISFAIGCIRLAAWSRHPEGPGE